MLNRYNAEIVAGALLPNESRILAELKLSGTSDEQVRHLLVADNVLQKRSRSTAIRMAQLIEKRMRHADEQMLELIANGPRAEATQALMFTAIKHSMLLGDFITLVVKDHWRRFETKLRPADWNEFLTMCEQLDPSVTDWKTTTRAKLGQVVRKCLHQAGYLDNARDSHIIPVHLSAKIREYLLKPGNEYVHGAMDLFS